MCARLAQDGEDVDSSEQCEWRACCSGCWGLPGEGSVLAEVCVPALTGSDLRVSYRQDCVEQLLKNMFDGDQTESCLVSGTQVLLALLEPRRAG